MSRIIKNQNRKVFVFLSLMLFLFCVTKVIRGSNTDSNANGGIWNYISLAYYPIFILLLFRKRKIRISWIYFSLFVYSLIATLVSITSLLDQSLSINSLYTFLMVPYSVIVMYCFYFASYDNSFTRKILFLTFVFCLIINLYNVATYKIWGAKRALASDIYFSLTLFPFSLLIVKNRIIKLLCISGMFLASFLSAKRTAFIGFIISMLLYVMVKETNKGSSIKHIVKLLSSLIILSVILFITSDYIDSYFNLGLFERLNQLQEDGGGGRADIYEQVFTAFKVSPWYQKLFGHGMFETLNVCGFMAHNDFLEVLYDYGLIAFASIVSFYLALIKKGIDLAKRKSEYAPSFVSSIAIGLLLSMFSYMLVYFTYVTSLSAYWGYVLKLEKDSHTLKFINGDDRSDGL